MFFSNIKQWIEDDPRRIYRYWPLRNGEPIVETCYFGMIVEAVVLPDGDVLLGFQEQEDFDYIAYYKLSEIELNWSASDNY